MNETERLREEEHRRDLAEARRTGSTAQEIDRRLQARDAEVDEGRAEEGRAMLDASRVQLQALDELRTISELIKLVEELPQGVGEHARAGALEKLTALANRALVQVMAVFPGVR